MRNVSAVSGFLQGTDGEKQGSGSGAKNAFTVDSRTMKFGEKPEEGQLKYQGATMANSIQEAKITGFAAYLPKVAQGSLEDYQVVFDRNRHRIYSFAFWMTDNELAAQELQENTFRRAFSNAEVPSDAAVDDAFLTELRDLMAIGLVTLDCGVATEISDVRSNVKRVHLERAVVQLPATERLIYVMHDGEGYSHGRIGGMLGLNENETKFGLHQARLRIRELVSQMK